MVGSSITTTIQEGENRFLQFDFPTDGLTLAISVLQGRLSVFGSFSIQNPTPLSACEIQIIDLTAGSNATGTACSQLFSNNILAPESGGPSSPLLFVGIIGEENGTSFTLETSGGASKQDLELLDCKLYLLFLMVLIDMSLTNGNALGALLLQSQ